MFDAVDVQITQHVKEGTQATWSCVFTKLRVGGDDAVKKDEPSV